MKQFISGKKLISCVAIVVLIFGTSCTSQLKISTGANDNRPLNFNNEYTLQDLEPIEVEGSAFWGIPSFSSNSKSKRSTGFLFTFNGVEMGRSSRILPLLTLAGMSFYGGMIISDLAGYKEKSIYGRTYITDELNIQPWQGAFLAMPVAGVVNNFLWRNAAFNSATQVLNYRLINENPKVDVFFYPKYDVSRTQDLFGQRVNVNARVSGAILKKK